MQIFIFHRFEYQNIKKQQLVGLLSIFPWIIDFSTSQRNKLCNNNYCNCNLVGWYCNFIQFSICKPRTHTLNECNTKTKHQSFPFQLNLPRTVDSWNCLPICSTICFVCMWVCVFMCVFNHSLLNGYGAIYFQFIEIYQKKKTET